ncbi:hypothetical protein [Streptomyces sp. NPDC006463]|uniref:hypothetical protein n=1 Tax=Streptomyces sp. NPDC006463 TaxID=3364746 RepID=UPI0036AEF007
MADREETAAGPAPRTGARTIDAYARGLAECLLVCAREGFGPALISDVCAVLSLPGRDNHVPQRDRFYLDVMHKHTA